MRQKTEYLTVRMNSGLKKEFWQFCEGTGMSASAVISLLAKKCISGGTIPFDVVSLDTFRLRNQDHSNDIRVSFRMEPALRIKFSDVCRESIGVPMSAVIKAFMWQCVKLGYSSFKDGQDGTRKVTFLD